MPTVKWAEPNPEILTQTRLAGLVCTLGSGLMLVLLAGLGVTGQLGW